MSFPGEIDTICPGERCGFMPLQGDHMGYSIAKFVKSLGGVRLTAQL
jgi:hypothetical protein